MIHLVSISSTFYFSYKRRFGSFFYVHVTREKLPKQRSYKKFVRKMLMKLTIGKLKVVFILLISLMCKILNTKEEDKCFFLLEMEV